MFVSFVILLNILGFGIIFLVLSNGSQVDNLVYIAESDAIFGFVIASAGVVLNLVLAYVLWRGSVQTRQLESRLRIENRSRITGE
jgi:hypothetical protein